MNQPKTQSTKPSAGALRAAKEISLKTIIRSKDNMVVSYASTTQVADIIDRETGVAELLEAAKEAVLWIAHLEGQVALLYTSKESKDLLQAIAKCEGGE